MAEGMLELPTLGRPMQLGMLYDCRNDSLIPELTLWDPTILQNDLDSRPKPGTQMDIISSDGIDDKASALKVDEPLKASFLSGLVEVQGSAKFLCDSKVSQHQSRLTLHYRTTTKIEQLTMKQLERHNVQHPDVFDQGTATHVITGILYGAQAFFVFDRDYSQEENLQDVQAQLHDIVKNVSAEINGSGSHKLSERENVDKVQCKFYGDFTLEKNPSNYDEAVSICKKLPSLLGSNGENAVPMRVWLYPLHRLDQKATKLVREISVNLISQFQGILEGLEQLQVKCNDLLKTEICTEFPQFPDKLNQLKKLLLEYKVSFQQYVARVLFDIRGGGVEEETLAQAIRSSQQSPFSLQGLNRWVERIQKEMNVVKACMNAFTGIQVIKSRDRLDELVSDLSVDHVICFSFAFTGREEYFVALSQHLKSSHPYTLKHSPSPAVERSHDPSVTRTTRLRAKQFEELYHANEHNKKVAFAVIGFDDGEALGQKCGTIQLYEEGELATKAFEPPGKPSVSRTTHNEVSLEWQAPKCGLLEVMYYRVKYRGMKPGSQSYSSSTWMEARTTSDERNITVQGLQPFTSYEFHVVAVCRAEFSIKSEGSDICTTLAASAPARVKGHGVSESSMTIVWEQPDLLGEGVVIEHYMIRYKQIGASSVAVPTGEATKSTGNQSCLFSIDDVQAGERYSVWVAAVCGSAGIGTESEPIEIDIDPVHKPVTYAETVAQDSDILVEGCESEGKPTIFKVSLNCTSGDSSDKYRSYRFGRKFRETQNHKVIMVVGATGAGKSTLINGMINYILRVDWKDGFRFKIVDEKGEASSKSQAHSQTQIITSYTINGNSEHNIPYALTIIDTPGFGDTRGIKRDKAIVDKIRHFFSHTGAHQVDHIDAIGFVAQSSQARLTHTQRYVFDSILSIFGKDISSNILLLLTFCDGQKPPVIDAIKEAEIPCNMQTMFKFNNSALFASNKTASVRPASGNNVNNGTVGESSADKFDEMFWQMGMQSMRNFFSDLNKLEPRSLTLTKEVLEERKRLEVAIEGLQPQIQMGVRTLEGLRVEQQILEQHEAEIKANKEFEYEVEVPKSRQISISGEYITNCANCHFTCHYPCKIPDDKNKRGCAAMDKENGVCTVCPGKCVWNDHYNQAYRFEYYTEKEKRKYADLEKRYNDATGKKLTVQQVIHKHTEEFLHVQLCVCVLITTSNCSIRRLDEIALKPNPLSTVEYIDLMIESEKVEAKPEWASRVQELTEVRQNAELISKVQKADFNPFGSYSEVLSKNADERNFDLQFLVNTVANIDQMIESEKAEAKPGWKSKVKELTQVKKNVEMMSKVKRVNSNPFESYSGLLSKIAANENSNPFAQYGREFWARKKSSKETKLWYQFWK